MKVLIVCAHPRQDSFTHALTEAARLGAERAGHHVTVLDLYALGFDPVMSAAERAAYETDTPILDPMAVEHAALVTTHDVLVFVYPTWWSTMPAMLKGWLEKVMVMGVAFRLEGGRVRPALHHVHRIVGISTYGSPWWVVKAMNDGGRRTFTRSLRLSCGPAATTSWIGCYSIDTAGAAERAAFVDRVGHTMARLDATRTPWWRRSIGRIGPRR